MAQRTAQLELKSTTKYDTIFFDNPDILLFKNVFRRHANYSKFVSELKEVDASDLTNTKSNDTLQEISYNINRKGDLLTNLFLEFEVEYNHPEKEGKEFYTVDHFGNAIVREAKFLIGDNYLVDSYQSFMKQMCKELEVKSHKTFVEPDSTHGGLPSTFYAGGQHDHPRTVITEEDKYYGDMRLVFAEIDPQKTRLEKGKYTKKFRYNFDFYFCKDYGSSFPLVSTTTQDVKIKFTLENINNLRCKLEENSLSIKKCKIFGEYVLLDSTIKNYFISSKLDYIYLQYHSSMTKTPIKHLNGIKNITNFRGFVRDIIWGVRPGETTISDTGPCYLKSMTGESLYKNSKTITTKIHFNGQPLYKENSDVKTFTRDIPGKNFNNIPPLDRIGVYTFSLKPMNPQFSGLINASTIKSMTIDFNFNNNSEENKKNTFVKDDDELLIFTRNYNVLNVSGGLSATPLFI